MVFDSVARHYEMPTAAMVGDFGTGVSPVLADSTVVLLRDELKDPKIVALYAVTGEPKWEVKRKSNSCFSTVAIWDTPDGKQIVAPGFGRMIGYDLVTGEEKWFVEGMPSSACTTPVVVDGNLFFAGWSPGDPSDADSPQMPTFDDLLKEGDTNGDGVLSKEEADKSSMKSFFNSVDTNIDGNYTREEADGLKR